MDFAEVRPEPCPGPRSEKARPESLDLGQGNMYSLFISLDFRVTDKSKKLLSYEIKNTNIGWFVKFFTLM